MIEIDIRDAVRKLKKDFPLGTKAQRDQATMRALNRVIDMTRTAASRELRNTYTFKLKDLKGKLNTVKSSRTSLTAYVKAPNTTITIYRFLKNANGLNKPKRNTRLQVEIFKGKRKLLPKEAFVTSRKGQQNPLVFMRGKYSSGQFDKDQARTPINPLKTVSPYGAGINKAIQNTMNDTIKTRFPDRLAHEMANLMR